MVEELRRGLPAFWRVFWRVRSVASGGVEEARGVVGSAFGGEVEGWLGRISWEGFLRIPDIISGLSEMRECVMMSTFGPFEGGGF